MLLNIINTMLEADRWLFRKINGEWINPFFDNLMPFAREANDWLPLYLFLIVFVTLNFKNGWWWVLFFLCTIAVSDLSGTYIFKKNIIRLRPCSDIDLASHIRVLLNRCGGGSSFISNHASNHFAMTAFIYLSFRKQITSPWLRLIFLWPFLIAYAQVYVGLHYPSDIFCGALWGLLIGSMTAYFFNKRYGIAIFDNQPLA